MRTERAILWALGALAFAAPLAIGGAHPITQIILSAFCFGLTLLYFVWSRARAFLRVDALSAIMAMCCAWTLLQLVPLPPAFLRVISPHAFVLRGGAVAPITLDVPGTFLAAVRGFLCLGALLMARSAALSPRRARLLFTAIAASGGTIAVITIIERLAHAEKILGFYRPHALTGSGVFGTFVNGNHAASLFMLAGLIAVGLAIDAEDLGRAIFSSIAALCMACTLYTGSRAGSLALGAGLFTLCLLLFSRRVGATLGVPLALAMLLVGAGAAYYSADLLRSRLDQAKGIALYDNQKTRGWTAGWKLAMDYPLVGVGRGAFAGPVAGYRENDERVRLTYPENFFIQRASEWGFPITLAMIAFAVRALWNHRRRLRYLDTAGTAALVGVAAVFLHEFADFGLELSGVALPVCVALGASLAVLEERGALSTYKVSRNFAWPMLAVWALVLGAAPWASAHTFDRDFARSVADEGRGLDAAIARHPAADSLQLLRGRQLIGEKRYSEAMKQLNHVLQLNPANGQAHDFVARLLLSTHHVSQAALEFRLAQEAGHPVSFAELSLLLGNEIVDAVPQDSHALFALATQLASANKNKSALEAAERAVELADDAAWAQRQEVALLDTIADASLVRTTAAKLTRLRLPIEVALALAETQAKVGLSADALATLSSAHDANKQNVQLVLSLAKHKLASGDVAGADELLRHLPTGATLLELATAADATAEIADRQGATEAAVFARLRARQLRKKSSAGVTP